MESSVAADFDLLAGSILAGKAPLIVAGFDLITTGITKPTSLQVRVADAALIHFYATEAGSIFHVPATRSVETLSTTNTRVTGSFLPSQVNYVGLDLVRTADTTTTDLVQFMDSNTLLESPKSVPLARTLDYRIVVSASDFDNNPGIAPIAKVTLDANGDIDTIEDARRIFWRLGGGGTVPDPRNAFPWAAGRKESESGPFEGGDKAITSLKGWMDAVMTRVWELGGGEYWYSPTQDHNVVMVRSGATFASTGEYFEWDGADLHWKNIALVFSNSTGIKNEIADQTTDSAGLTDLDDGECIYVDVDRTQNLTGGDALQVVKAPLATLGSSDIPGSRWVLAWRYGGSIFTRDQSYAVGSAFKLATVAAAGMIKASASNGNLSTPLRAATVDAVSFEARAAGLSRGFRSGQTTPSVSDFVGGAGDLYIGGGYDGANGTGGGNPVDYNVRILTNRLQDETKITGAGIISNGVAALLVEQLGTGYHIIARLRGRDQTNAQTDQFHFFTDGSVGFANVDGDLTPAPAPVSGAQIRSKLFFRTNGIATPNTRDQFCVKWFDDSVDVLAESPTY